MDLILLLIFVVVFLASYLFLSRPKGLPPGPIVFPFIGSYPFLKQLKGRLPHIVYLDAAKKYGNIFSFKVGQERFVVLTGYEAINQALVKQADVFSDRPNWIEFLKDFYKDGIGKAALLIDICLC